MLEVGTTVVEFSACHHIDMALVPLLAARGPGRILAR